MSLDDVANVLGPTVHAEVGVVRVGLERGYWSRTKASPLFGFIGITNWFAPAS